MKLSKETEQQIAEFQGLQGQLQSVMIQKQQVQTQVDELAQASEELKSAKGAVFRSAGTLLIQSTREEAEKDVAEKKELYSVRANALSRQEERLKARLTELKQKLEQVLGRPGGESG